MPLPLFYLTYFVAGVIATLYRIGETEITYEERAKSAPIGSEPEVETGTTRFVEVMGSWVQDLSDNGELDSFEDFS